jgi:hypothetical protein
LNPSQCTGMAQYSSAMLHKVATPRSAYVELEIWPSEGTMIPANSIDRIQLQLQLPL